MPYSIRRSAFRNGPIDGRKTPYTQAWPVKTPGWDWSSPPYSAYRTTGWMRNGRWIFASTEASEFPFGVFPALSRCPCQDIPERGKAFVLPFPPKWSAREAPSSRYRFGRMAKRIPETRESG